MNLRLPHKHLLKYKGKTYSTYYVRISQSGVRDQSHDELHWCNESLVPVIAQSPADAIRLVQDEIGHLVQHPTEFECMGPKGGIVHRFIGWESMIAQQMFHCRPMFEQLTLRRAK